MPKEKGLIHIPAVLFLVGVLVLSLTLITSLKEQPSFYNQSQILGDDSDSSGLSGSSGSSDNESSGSGVIDLLSP